MSEVVLTSENFEDEVKNYQGVALVDFWAAWCGPCQLVGPIIRQVSEDLGDKAKIGKVNVDNNRDIMQEFGIQGIPTVILFKNGKEIERFVGARQLDFYKEQINKHQDK